MKNKIKKYNAVVRIRSNTTGVIKERGFVSINEAENAYWFVADIADEYDIFYRLDWMPALICRKLTPNTGLARETRERRNNSVSLFFYPITLVH